MSDHEFDDPELINAIEDFLRQGKKADSEEETTSLSAIREEWRELVPRMFAQNQRLNEFLRQAQGIPTAIIPREQAVVANDELATLANSTAQIVLKSGISCKDHEGITVRRYPESDFEAFMVGLKDNAIPQFLSAKCVIFENWRSGNIISDSPRLAEALGIGDRPTGKLIITSPVGILTDPQTRPVMERSVSEFPEAPDIRHFHTEYYFWGKRIGKAVNLPPSLLSKRIIVAEADYSPELALSEVITVDLVIAKIGLLAVKRRLISQLA